MCMCVSFCMFSFVFLALLDTDSVDIDGKDGRERESSGYGMYKWPQAWEESDSLVFLWRLF